MKPGGPKSSLGAALAVLVVVAVAALAIVGAVSLSRQKQAADAKPDVLVASSGAQEPVSLDRSWYVLGGSPLQCLPIAETFGHDFGPDEFVASKSKTLGARVVSRTSNEVLVETRGDKNPIVFLRGLENCEAAHIGFLQQKAVGE